MWLIGVSNKHCERNNKVNYKEIIIFGLKTLFLTLILCICFLTASLLVGLPVLKYHAALALTTMCFFDVIVLSYLIVRSHWYSWKLITAVFIVFFGVKTFLSQVETVVFLQYLVKIVPTELIPQLFIHGAITAALFTPIAVFTYNKTSKALGEHKRLAMPVIEWFWKLALIATIYIIIYITFGMFVFMPLAGEAAQEYYANLQLPPWIIPFQGLRALIFTGIAILIVKMMKGRWLEAGLMVALTFSVIMGSSLLLPNEFMPINIRLAHLVEIMSSNFIYGWLIILILRVNGRIT